MKLPNTSQSSRRVDILRVLTIVSVVALSVQFGHAQQFDGRTIDFDLNFTATNVVAGQLFEGPAPEMVLSKAAPLNNEFAVLINRGPCNSPVIENFATISGYQNLLVADLTGNGLGDVVVQSPTAVSVLLNLGTTNDFLRLDYIFSSPNLDQGTALVDVDGDGDLDLASNTSILPNLGGGVFGTAYILTTPGANEFTDWRWGDFDGDGDADLVGARQVPIPTPVPVLDNLEVRWWESNGSLTIFSQQNTFTFPTPISSTIADVIEVTDINRDGLADVLTGAIDQSNLQLTRMILLGAPFGVGLSIFGAGPTVVQVPALLRGQGADLDGDGFGEFIPATVNLSGASSLPETRPLNFTPAGLVPSGQSYPTIDGKFAFADFNDDGTQDIAVVSNGSSERVRLLFGGTDPLFRLAFLSGGGPQVAADGGTLPIPVVIELRDCFGEPAPGQTIEIAGAPVGSTTAGSGSLVTDSQGQIVVDFVFNGLSSGNTITLSYGLANSLSFIVDVVPSNEINTLNPVEEFYEPDQPFSIMVQALTSLGQAPAAGLQITANFSPGLQLLNGPGPIATDANGLAEFIFSGNPGAASQGIVFRDLNDPNSVSVITVFIRGLEVSLPNPGSAVVTYAHENPGLPVILAADMALPAPGFVQTIYGDIYTSVLAPQASLVVLDGFQVPGLVTPLDLSIGLPPGIAGQSIVVQCYGMDPAYSGVENIFVSNPVFVTF